MHQYHLNCEERYWGGRERATSELSYDHKISNSSVCLGWGGLLSNWLLLIVDVKRGVTRVRGRADADDAVVWRWISNHVASCCRPHVDVILQVAHQSCSIRSRSESSQTGELSTAGGRCLEMWRRQASWAGRAVQVCIFGCSFPEVFMAQGPLGWNIFGLLVHPKTTIWVALLYTAQISYRRLKGLNIRLQSGLMEAKGEEMGASFSKAPSLGKHQLWDCQLR